MTPPMLHAGADTYAERVTAMSKVAQANVRVELDVAYGGDPRQRLDVYLPEAVRPGGVPVLCFLHGGAWRNGDKVWMGFLAPLFVDLPAVFVSVGYRLSPAHRFPSHLEDAREAFAWVRTNVAGYGGDPQRLFVGGHSAGGHLAVLAALRHPELGVAGCLPLSAACDLRRAVGNEDVPAAVYDEVLARPEDAQLASPLCYADAAHQPFLLAYGEKDFPRIRHQGAALAAALRRAGVAVTVLELPGADHFEASAGCTSRDHPWVVAARSFIAGPPPVTSKGSPS